MSDLTAAALGSPDVYPQSFDPATGAVMLIAMSEAAYESASFLDGRELTPETAYARISWRELETAAAALHPERESGWIFHLGHAGSTLLSRLIGAHPDVLALREPAPLRTLAAMAERGASVDTQLDTFVALWSRTYAPGQVAVVKATSFASQLGPRLLAGAAAPRAILMFTRAPSWLAGIFSGEVSRRDNAAMASRRLERLHRRIGAQPWRIDEMSEGERVAMSWACEMLSLDAAASTGGARAMWLDFDRFLDEPVAGLGAVFAHLGVAATAAETEALIGGPLMRRYSKASEHAYGPEVRRAALASSHARHATEIAAGLAWLDRAGCAYPAIAAALAR